MRRIILAAAVTAAAAVVLAAPASADVARYQTQSATLTADVNSGAYVHTYAITIDPCDGSFVGAAVAGSVIAGETVTGTLTNPVTIDFDGLYPSGYAWSYTGPLTGGTGNGPGGQTFDVTFTLNVTGTSTWKNHGQYVKAMGGGSEAAQSCIGKPIPYSWSQSGTIASTLAGTSVTLPVAGWYRLDVAGTWTNGGYGWVDAEYTDNGVGGYADGFDRAPWLLGPNFGDLTVGGAFVDWGAYSPDHTYSYTGSFAAGALNLALGIFDGEAGVPVAGWYGDNTGSLSYTITFVGS
jgi:hypothetical protein